jgi:TPR repeat protein
MPTSPIGDFFNDQDDMEIDTDTRSIDTTAPVKFVRQDSVRMRQAAPIAAPSTAIIEKLQPSQHLNHHYTAPLTPASPPINQLANQPQQSSSASSSPHSPEQQAVSRGNSNDNLGLQKQQNKPQNPVEAMVQSGIQYHEAGKLEKATDYFRQAAAKDSPMGMFLYGVSLRHGWVKRHTTSWDDDAHSLTRSILGL